MLQGGLASAFTSGILKSFWHDSGLQIGRIRYVTADAVRLSDTNWNHNAKANSKKS